MTLRILVSLSSAGLDWIGGASGQRRER